MLILTTFGVGISDFLSDALLSVSPDALSAATRPIY